METSVNTLEEVLMVLPHDLKLFLSKSIKLDYKRLLRDLVNFQYDDARDKVKVSWAKDYLGMEEE